MKIVKAGHEHISREGLTPYQFVEKIGRICYKSDPKGKPEEFVQKLVRSGHTAMIEHFWVHLTYHGDWETLENQIDNLMWNTFHNAGDTTDFFKYCAVTYLPDIVYISMPIRVVTQLADAITNKLVTYPAIKDRVPSLVREFVYQVQVSYPHFFSDLCYMYCAEDIDTSQFLVYGEQTFIDLLKKQDMSDIEETGGKNREIMKHSTHTVLLRCNRGVSHELVRHRPCSFAQESTRYCNYSKEKFGREITVIDPTTAGFYPTLELYKLWAYTCDYAEKAYFKLLDAKVTPQEARGVLPNDLKTEVIMTTNETEWQHIVNLRAKQTTGKAHPQMVEIMIPWYEELKVLSEGRIV